MTKTFKIERKGKETWVVIRRGLLMATMEEATDKVTLVCNECGKKRQVSAEGSYNERCPKCGGVDWDVSE